MKKRGRKREEAVEITLAELRAMVPVFIAGNAATLLGCIIYGANNGFAFGHYTGLLVGNVVSLLNFWFIGLTAAYIIRRKNAVKARRFSNMSYGLRYIVMFAMLAALTALGAINPIPAVIPLFFPKIHYTVQSIINKEV